MGVAAVGVAILPPAAVSLFTGIPMTTLVGVGVAGGLTEASIYARLSYLLGEPVTPEGLFLNFASGYVSSILLTTGMAAW